jgi:tetratricopeptide (TPR) repeat protein
MRSVYFVVVILLLISELCAGQTAGKLYTDSLNRLAWKAISTDPGLAHTLASLALKTAKAIKYEEGVALAYNRFGKIHATKGNFDSAIFYYQQNLNLRFKEKNPSGLANTFINLGDVYLKKGNQVRALRL